MRVINILDLDLDFFMKDEAVFTGSPPDGQRLDSEEYSPWTIQMVRKFIENQCGITTSKRVPGKVLTNHNELFFELRSLHEKSKGNFKFNIDHIDAHSDTGLWDDSYIFIFTHWINYSKQYRLYPPVEKVKINNFLIFLACAELLNSLNYVSLEQNPADIGHMYFKYVEKNPIAIKFRFYQDLLFKSNVDVLTRLRTWNPNQQSKDIPFNQIYHKYFQAKVKYDYIFLTQSPEYTPIESDELIPIIQEYMEDFE
jgi:hypothetical protein